MASTSQCRWKSWGMALTVSLSLFAICVAFAPAMVYGGGHHSYGHHSYGHSYGYGHHSYGYSPYSYGYSPYSYGYSYRPYSYGRGYSDRPYSAYSEKHSYGSGGGSSYSPGGTYGYPPSQSRSGGGTTSGETVGDADSHALGGRGWSLLAAGQNDAALSAFADQAENNPHKGGPKVGYALSAAIGGDFATGVWAMRRACRIDPQAMHYIALDSKLRSRVTGLIRRYQTDGAPDGRNADSSFMLAALHYLTGDMAAARTAVERSIEFGDTTSSAAHLRRLIGTRRAAHPATEQSSRPGSLRRPRYEPPPVPPADQRPPMPRSRTDA